MVLPSARPGRTAPAQALPCRLPNATLGRATVMLAMVVVRIRESRAPPRRLDRPARPARRLARTSDELLLPVFIGERALDAAIRCYLRRHVGGSGSAGCRWATPTSAVLSIATPLNGHGGVSRDAISLSAPGGPPDT